MLQVYMYANISVAFKQNGMFLEDLLGFAHKKDKYMVLKKDGSSCGQHPDKGLDMNLTETPAALAGVETGMRLQQ